MAAAAADVPPRRRRLRRFAFGNEASQEVEKEIRAHLEHSTGDLMAAGLAPAEAAAEARRRFGDPGSWRDACCAIEHRQRRIRHRLELWRDLLLDLRLAARGLAASPGFAAAALLTLGVGLAANIAVFAVIYGVLLKPLPFAYADRLAMLWESNPEKGWTAEHAAAANFLDWRESNAAFSDIAAYGGEPRTVPWTGEGDPRVLIAASVTGNFFDVLGVPPARGRGFRMEETWAGHPVALVSDKLWRTQLGSDPGVLSRTLRLRGTVYTVVGVMPPGFSYPFTGLDLWLPLGLRPEDRQEESFRRAHWLRPIGRLRPGVSFAQAGGYLAAAAARLERQYPRTNHLMGAGLTPLHEWWVGGRRPALLLLLGAVGLVLLIACANVANLQLARGLGRGREMAVRLAMGASPGRLLRQLLAENLLLAVLAGALGLPAAAWAVRTLVALAPGDLPRAGEIGLHPAVLVFGLAVSLVAALLFGLAPALAAARTDGGRSLVPSRNATLPRGAQRTRHTLVVAEIALATLVVAGAGLLLRSFDRLRHVDPGFHADHLLAVNLVLPGKRYPEAAQQTAFYDRLLERAAALPGVTAAAVADALPPTDGGWTTDLAIAGHPPGEHASEIHHRLVSADYFKALRVPLRRGRLFAAGDTAKAPPVVLVNERLARGAFAGSDPIGQRITFDSLPAPHPSWLTIVGVVGDERMSGLAQPPPPQVFELFEQAPMTSMILVLRTPGDPLALVRPVRTLVSGLDHDLPLVAVDTVEGVLERTLASNRFLALLMVAFGGAALALATVGVAAVVAFNVTQRTRELGIRMALGATASQVAHQTIQGAFAYTALGIALGVAAALGAARLVRSLLFATGPSDPATFALTIAVLGAAALAAAYLPARRVLRIDPAISLRHD